jgi:putative transposase
VVRCSARNVKRWQSGDMGLRWTAAGMLEAERQFRRIIGFADPPSSSPLSSASSISPPARRRPRRP